MSFFDPTFGILRRNGIPTLCPHCKRTMEEVDLAPETKEALVQTTVYHELREEFEFICRANLLIDRFANSRHSIVVKMLYLSNAPTTETDSDFDNELDRDAELKDFLTNNHFYLPARTEFVKGRLKELTAWTQRDDVRCPQCDGYIVLPFEFYTHIGLHPLEEMT